MIPITVADIPAAFVSSRTWAPSTAAIVAGISGSVAVGRSTTFVLDLGDLTNGTSQAASDGLKSAEDRYLDLLAQWADEYDHLVVSSLAERQMVEDYWERADIDLSEA